MHSQHSRWKQRLIALGLTVGLAASTGVPLTAAEPELGVACCGEAICEHGCCLRLREGAKPARLAAARARTPHHHGAVVHQATSTCPADCCRPLSVLRSPMHALPVHRLLSGWLGFEAESLPSEALLHPPRAEARPDAPRGPPVQV